MKGISSRSLIDGGGGGQSLEGLDAQYTGTNGVTGCLPVTVGARPDALRPVLRTVGLTQAVSEPSAPEKAATSAGTGLQRLHRKQGSVRSMTHIRYAQCTWKGAPYADTVDTEHNLKLALPNPPQLEDHPNKPSNSSPTPWTSRQKKHHHSSSP